MAKHSSSTYWRAFADVLFLGPRSDNIRQLNLIRQISIYFLALAFFYVPIFYFIVRSSISDNELIPYFVFIAAIHILSKIMLYNSKRIQLRFSAIKKKKILFRIWLMIEYIVFMWLVYLFYPLTCILVPFSLLGMAFESMLGFSAFLGLFLNHTKIFFIAGGIASYVFFILADGYKKLKTGFLPDYLVLYALLAMISGSIEKAMQNVSAIFNLTIDIGNFTTGLSDLFILSNNSMNIVASVMTALFALHSLYTNCGIVPTEKEEEPEPEPQEDEPTLIVHEDIQNV